MGKNMDVIQDYFEESTEDEEIIIPQQKTSRKQMIKDFSKQIIAKIEKAHSKGLKYDIDNHTLTEEFINEDDDTDHDDNPARTVYMRLIIALLFVPFVVAGFIFYYYIVIHEDD
eukprot:Mrub_13692.p1 GENE.Mrub_13692~~Mrub_13692.p1  ORF type:complete len:121 (+),score=9.75 Mrub_13692:24-365(+)